MKKYTLISPHVDDEGIGCYRQIILGNISQVIYVDKVDGIRKQEACSICDTYRIPYVFLDGDIGKLCNLDLRYSYLIPSPTDNHNLHKLVYYTMTRLYKSISVYSVYMNDYWIKEVEDAFEKKDFLNKFYPSQKSLWETEWKYFLYEGLIEIK